MHHILLNKEKSVKKIFVLSVLIITFIGFLSHDCVAQETDMSIHGYFDGVLGHNRYGSETWGFDAYHFTTIVSYDWKSFRLYGDVTYEHGPQHTSTNLGDIKVRAMLTWTQSYAFHVNVGKFLTPFGEYNLYHDATPVYTSVQSPRSMYWKRILGEDDDGNSVKGRLFSKEATGIWAWGYFDVHDWEVEYNVYLANGRGEGNYHKIDDNEDKAVGGKITINSPFGLKVGGSFYTEEHGKIADDPRVKALAGQFEYARGDFFVGGEVIHAEIGDDLSALAWYGQIQYLFSERFTPYVRVEHFDDSQHLNPEEDIVRTGLNIRVNSRTFLKAEYARYAHDMDDVFQSQITFAF